MQTMERPPVAPVNRRAADRRRGRSSSTARRSARSGSWRSPASGSWASCSSTWSATSRCTWAPRTINHYGECLRELLVPLLPRTWSLWLLRIGLTAAFVLHIHAAVRLTLMNRRAHAEGATSPSATTGRQRRQPLDALDRRGHPAVPDLPPGRPDLGARPTPTSCGATSTATSSPASSAVDSAIYIVANVALGVHLFHGAWSMFQSLGLNNPSGTRGAGASPSASPPS